jgi:diacylglycerol kinase family enzyme
MSGIGVIVNRKAGRSRSCAKLGYVLGNSESYRETDSVSEIDEVARLFLRQGVDLLCIGGGDGSIQQVLTSFIKTYGDRPLPRVAFLRAGTHNACARSIGQTGDPESILSRIVRKYHTAEPMDLTGRTILRVSHGMVVRYGFTLSTGFMYRYFRRVHASGHNTPLTAAALLLSLFGSAFIRSAKIENMFRMTPSRITLGGVDMPWDRCNGVAASSMEQVGLGLRPFSRANESPGNFHSMAFRMRPSSFIRAAWALGRGRLRSSPDYLSTVTDSLVVESTEPVPYALDGDVFAGGLRLEIRSGPRLELIVV